MIGCTTSCYRDAAFVGTIDTDVANDEVFLYTCDDPQNNDFNSWRNLFPVVNIEIGLIFPH